MALMGIGFGGAGVAPAQDLPNCQPPPFVAETAPPLNLLVLGRNHKLWYEAYNDASDLNQDQVLDIWYKPQEIDYYGYFDSYLCYEYDESAGNDGRFEPSASTPDKMCSGDDEWSGDFLNYLTMSRMDTLRRVLYGGKRSIDTTTETVLERSYIPQDAHSWGKEYRRDLYDRAENEDGFDYYDIRDYTPMGLPADGTRHLFANTTLDQDGDGEGHDDPPLLRVLNDSTYRIWEWVSIERPVAGQECQIPGSGTSQRYDCESSGSSACTTDPFTGGDNPALIDEDGEDNNPFGPGDEYFTTIEGQLTIPFGKGGDYTFSVNGDDAVEAAIDANQNGVFDDSEVTGWYGGHGEDRSRADNWAMTLDLSGGETYEIRFLHEEQGGGDNYELLYKDDDDDWAVLPSSFLSGLERKTYDISPSGANCRSHPNSAADFAQWLVDTPASEFTNYVVRVKACDTNVAVGDACRSYGDQNPDYKPAGLIQKFGEDNSMLFGLLTGSYEHNLRGGMLRRNMGSIQDEIDLDTGQFIDPSSGTGLITTIDRLRMEGFNYSGGSGDTYNENCGWITDGPLSNGRCRMWGNPLAEMLYEGLRYYAGTESPASEFYTTGGDDGELNLPHPAWEDPFETHSHCAKPFMLAISDIYPTFDSDQLPGSRFGGISSDLPGLDVGALGDRIWDEEFGGSRTHFIGESLAASPTADDAPTAKAVTSLGDIRGLAPEEPTKEGSYYSASVAHYGLVNDINADAEGDQNVSSLMVGLASPLPRIEIPVGTEGLITLVPFAKSVRGFGISADPNDYQPTNTIVDFYVEEVTPVRGSFRINYEDVEQGADHDMDAIVQYTYRLLDTNGDPVSDPASASQVEIELDSEYAAGSIIQHIGYVISGTQNDGTYLEVRDKDTNAGSDPDFDIDTPPGEPPGGNWNDGDALPLNASRTFEPGDNPAATTLDNPLWFSAKWGAFTDSNDNDKPDLPAEWDEDGDGTPDSYFFVINPLQMQQKLEAAFTEILQRRGTASAVSTVAQESREGDLVVRAYFDTVNPSQPERFAWSGHLEAFWPDLEGDYDFEQTGFTTCSADPDPHCYDVADALNDRAASDRRIFTVKGLESLSDTNPEEFDLPTDGAITSAELNALLPTGLSINTIDFNGDSNVDLADHQAFIRWLRGEWDDTWDGQARARGEEGDDFKLGDIAYSSPVIVGQPPVSSATSAAIYNEFCPTGNEDCGSGSYSSTCYRCYRKANHHRDPVVYVGANDGMLHAFQVGKWVDENADGDKDKLVLKTGEGADAVLGKELWAYIPSTLLPELHECAKPSFGIDGGCLHRTFVDLSPSAFDVKIDPDGDGTREWHTVLIGGLRGGGDTYFALDVTDPANPDVLWEHSVLQNLGFPVDPNGTTRAYSGDKYTHGGDYPLRLLPMSWSQVQAGVFDFEPGTNLTSGRYRPLPLGTAPDVNDVPLPNLHRRPLAFIGSGAEHYETSPPTDTITDAQWDYLFYPHLLALDIETGVNVFERLWPRFLRELWGDEIGIPALNGSDFVDLEVRAGHQIPARLSSAAVVDRNQDGYKDRLYVGSTTGHFFSLFPGAGGDSSGENRESIAEVPDEDMCLRVQRVKEIPTGSRETNTHRSRFEPITATPTVAFLPRDRVTDELNDLGIGFGTGKFDVVTGSKDDKTDTAQMAFYITEDDEVCRDDLSVSTSGLSMAVDNQLGRDLDLDVGEANGPWWCKRVPLQTPGERVNGQPFIADGVAFFSTFVPDDDVCSSGGSGLIYGTSFTCDDILDESPIEGGDEVTGEPGTFKAETGKGMPTRPELTTTGEDLILQTSDGAPLRQETQGIFPFQMQGWRLSPEEDDTP